MPDPSHDPSIEHEPHIQGGPFQSDSTEPRAERVVDRSANRQTDDDLVEQSVWDEPGLSPALAGETPADALTYAGWLEDRIANTTAGRSWAMCGVIAIAAGPWAILGAFLGGGARGATTPGIVAVIILSPLLEEMMKVAAALWVVEKRPFLFQARLQIGLCALAGGLAFAAVENVLYLNLYIPNPSLGLCAWRWTVCVALHMGCSLVAGFGLMRIWRHTINTRTRPHLPLGAPFFVTAIVIHGIYNALAVMLDLVGFHF